MNWFKKANVAKLPFIETLPAIRYEQLLFYIVLNPQIY